MHTPCYKPFYDYTASADIWLLPCKQRKVIVSTEFGGKQSHQIGPCLCGSNKEEDSVIKSNVVISTGCFGGHNGEA